MIGHYLTVAFRNFRRAPVATGINVLALALGLTCFVIAYAVVEYWNHAESHFAKADRTYAITRTLKLRNDSLNTGWEAITAEFYADYLKLDFPEFETIMRVRQIGEVQVEAGEQKMRLYSAFADPNFFDVFDLPFVAGDPKHAFTQPNSVILSDVAAMRLFGTTDAVGRTIHLGKSDFPVTGVLAPFPTPSHIGRTDSAGVRFDVLISGHVLEAGKKASDSVERKEVENWLDFNTQTYVVLPKGSKITPDSLKPAVAAFVKRREPKVEQNIVDLTIGMIPIRDVMAARLNTILFAGTGIGLSVTTLLTLFGGLVLLVACLNYANLATAQAMRRAKEVGLRKTIGASRAQIMAQYGIEAALLTIAALGIALVVAEVLAPLVTNATEIDLNLALFSGLGFWSFVAAVIAGVTLLAGAYPALYLSKIRPIQAIRSIGARSSGRVMPTILVGAQFTAASFLLIAVIVMTLQADDLRRTGLGANTDPIIVIPNDRSKTKIDPETFRTHLLALPEVKSVSSTNKAPWAAGADLMVMQRTPGDGRIQHTATQSMVDYDFFKTMDVPIVAGRAFDRARGEDKAPLYEDHFDPKTPVNVVIDRAFSDQLGFASPAAAVDQIVYMGLSQHGLPDQAMRIIGVVANKPLHFAGLGASASAFRLGSGMPQVVVRISGKDIPGALEAIKGVWAELAPGQVFHYSFEDQLFAQGYELYGRVAQAFTALALFAFAISTIGLVGMGSHVAIRRRHEIGVRKTLGASTRQVLVMLLKDFSKPVLVANVIAWPLAYLAVQAYLGVFIHRIAVTPVPFALSLGTTILIAWVAVGGQAVRAARVRPASVLRYE
jgi:putative ABC transport system permease protein